MKIVKLSVWGVTLGLAALLASCASTHASAPAPAPAPTPAPAAAPVAIVSPFASLEQKVIDINNSGESIAALGTGTEASGRRDIADQKARQDAMAKIATTYEVKIEQLTKNFTASDGNTDPTVTATFEQATKSVVSKTLNGVTQQAPSMAYKEGNAVTVGIVMGINQKLLNNSLLDEVKNQDPKLYDRFRASEAFKELDQAVTPPASK